MKLSALLLSIFIGRVGEHADKHLKYLKEALNTNGSVSNKKFEIKIDLQAALC